MHLMTVWEYCKVEVSVDVEAVEACYRRRGLGKRDVDGILFKVNDHLFQYHEFSSDDTDGVVPRLVFNEERYAKLDWTL